MDSESHQELGRALGRSLGADVRYCQRHLSENLHFRAAHPRFGRLFVKVYADRARCRTEGIVLGVLAERHDWVIPAVCADALPTGQWWRAFPERALLPFGLDPSRARIAGRILAELHGTRLRPGLDLPRTEPGWEVIEQRLRRLEVWPETYARAAALAERAEPVLRSLRGRARTRRLLSGDFGVRNLHVLREDGRPVLLDFERSVLGDPVWDLGKIWDQGMSTQQQRAAFMRGYREGGGGSRFPDRAALWATRFAAALGIFPYADRVGDTAFFQHGKEKLATLDTELPALLATIR